MSAPALDLAPAARRAVTSMAAGRRKYLRGHREPIVDTWRAVLDGIESERPASDERSVQLAAMATEAKALLADAEAGHTAVLVTEFAFLADGDQWDRQVTFHVDPTTCTGRGRARSGGVAVPLASVDVESRCGSDVCGPYWPAS